MSWRSPFQVLGRERSALAAALIVAIVLIGLFHAPVWAVLIGCSLAFAGILVRAWYRARSD